MSVIQYFNRIRTLILSIVFVSLLFSSCIKDYEPEVTLSLNEEFLKYRGYNEIDSLIITKPAFGDLYIQKILKDPTTGKVEVIDSRLITIINASDYNPTFEEDNDASVFPLHRRNSFILDSVDGTSSTLVYYSTEISSNHGLRINLETLTDVVSIDIYHQTAPPEDKFYFSVKGSIYAYLPDTYTTELLVNTGYSNLSSISLSPKNNRIYYTPSNKSSKDILYYDLETQTKKNALTWDHTIKDVKSIGNSESYLFVDDNGRAYIKGDNYQEEIIKRQKETILTASATYVNDAYVKLYSVNIPNWTTSSPATFRKQIGQNTYTSFNEDPDENLVISDDGDSFVFLNYNSTLGISNNSKTMYISKIEDADFNSKGDILYIKDGDVFLTNPQEDKRVLYFSYDKDIERITW